jgi:SAM-dependent methyltransferase
MVWDKIYKNKLPGHYMQYPSEAFVPLFFRALKHTKKNDACLDFGCGSGNNSMVLKHYFNKIYLVDISETALEIAKTRLKLPNLHCSTSIHENFPTFDFVLAWQVLYYNTKVSLMRLIDCFYRTMNEDAIILCSIVTHEDCKVRLSNKISEHEYKITMIEHQKGARIISCQNVEEFLSYFDSHFRILDYGQYGRKSYMIKDDEISEYYLIGQK